MSLGPSDRVTASSGCASGRSGRRSRGPAALLDVHAAPRGAARGRAPPRRGDAATRMKAAIRQFESL